MSLLQYNRYHITNTKPKHKYVVKSKLIQDKAVYETQLAQLAYCAGQSGLLYLSRLLPLIAWILI